MRPDEIEGLTGVFKPNLIHEIRCPVRLERPGGYRKTLQEPNLELQLCVRSCKLSRSLSDLMFERRDFLHSLILCLSFVYRELSGLFQVRTLTATGMETPLTLKYPILPQVSQ